VIIENALPVYTSKLSLELSNHKSPSCKDVPSALCVGALPDIWYISAKLFMSTTFAPALTMLVIFVATVVTSVALGTSL
jgi:hypothetical protein